MLCDRTVPELTLDEFDAGLAAGYHHLKSRLFRYAKGLIPVEDLVQDTCARALENRDKFRGPKEKLLPWLITIGRNLATDLRRKLKPQPEIVPYEEDSEEGDTVPLAESEDARANRQEQETLLRQQIARLPKRDRRAFILVRWRELSYDRAASLLRTTADGIDNSVRRGTARLRNALPVMSPRFRNMGTLPGL